MSQQPHQEIDDLQNEILRRFEKEQRDFENHWLWRELQMSPQDFFARIQRAVEASGIAPEEWQRKVTEAKQAIATRLRENRQRVAPRSLELARALRV